MKKFLFATFLFLAATGSRGNSAPATRSFELRETYDLTGFPAGAHTARVWFPLATSDDYQKVELANVVSATVTRRTIEPEYGDEALFTEIADPSSRPAHFELLFRAVRSEFSKNPSDLTDGSAKPAGVERFLRPDRLVPIDGKLRQLSNEITASKAGVAEKARSIYDYVFRTMKYDKSGEGWGRGDSLWACDSKRGNCTDFHSVFISLMRAQGIPARFEIGLPIGEPSSGDIAGYHCWAEFYLDGAGWVPVDISEAWKAPAKHDYFFGSIDTNRIRFSTGRDVTLNPRQNGLPLNYFVYPYVEVDGKPFEGRIDRKVSYADRPTGSS